MLQYVCRKILADSRFRVRGRFVKNDDFGEIYRYIDGYNEEEDYDVVSFFYIDLY